MVKIKVKDSTFTISDGKLSSDGQDVLLENALLHAGAGYRGFLDAEATTADEVVFAIKHFGWDYIVIEGAIPNAQPLKNFKLNLFY